MSKRPRTQTRPEARHFENEGLNSTISGPKIEYLPNISMPIVYKNVTKHLYKTIK